MGRGTSVQRAGRNEERIEAHAQDDGFPAQEDPSKTATGARSPAAREEGSAACTREREDLNQRMVRTAVDGRRLRQTTKERDWGLHCRQRRPRHTDMPRYEP